MLDELGLEVEQILLGWPARHVQVDDSLGLGREVRRPGLPSGCRPKQADSAEPPALLSSGPDPSWLPLPSRRSIDASAIAPSPVCDVLRNWRRVCACASCNVQQGRSSVHDESAFGQDAVEIQEDVGDRGPGGQIGRLHARQEAARCGSVARAAAASESLRYRSYSAVVESDERLDLLGPRRPAQAELQAISHAGHERPRRPRGRSAAPGPGRPRRRPDRSRSRTTGAAYWSAPA